MHGSKSVTIIDYVLSEHDVLSLQCDYYRNNYNNNNCTAMITMMNDIRKRRDEKFVTRISVRLLYVIMVHE